MRLRQPDQERQARKFAGRRALQDAAFQRRDKSKPADLHLPVGGRRFRPCLEDIIEFCILERVVAPRDGWKQALNKSRDEFLYLQLRTAVRRNPEAAADALKRHGWRVTEPDTRTAR